MTKYERLRALKAAHNRARRKLGKSRDRPRDKFMNQGLDYDQYEKTIHNLFDAWDIPEYDNDVNDLLINFYRSNEK